MALSPALKDAVNNVRSQAEKMQAIITIADELDKIGGLEQAAAEAEGRKVSAEAELSEVKSKIEVEQANLAGATKKLTDAYAAAKKIIDDAKDKAELIVADASTKAEAEGAKATDAAKAKLSSINADIKTAQDGLAKLNLDFDAAEAKLDSVVAETAEVQKRADDAKAYLAKLAGG